jgi:hypothetical protein
VQEPVHACPRQRSRSERAAPSWNRGATVDALTGRAPRCGRTIAHSSTVDSDATCRAALPCRGASSHVDAWSLHAALALRYVPWDESPLLVRQRSALTRSYCCDG